MAIQANNTLAQILHEFPLVCHRCSRYQVQDRAVILTRMRMVCGMVCRGAGEGRGRLGEAA
jgi:hypothetical protein